ncbi:hypothetical protein SEA_JETAIME_66 [Mycobacterium phage JeTaime]|nr:hypothetical protein SEA_JETAIME_66 [Mycobacterium phage JeTaime]
MNTIEILEKAKALAPEKWDEGASLGYSDSPCCILGLVGHARFGESWDHSYISLDEDGDAAAAVEALAAVSLPYGGDAQEKVYRHNDAHLKTVAQVQSFIDRAIENHRG